VSAAEAPLVGILVGSESDRDRMQPALDELGSRGIAHELEVHSAHRNPDAVAANSLNIALNAAFVLGLRWGIAGSAWGTVIAQSAARG